MLKLSIDKKTGFRTSLPFNIVDRKNIEFYNSDYTNHIKEGKELRFNLPPGDYFYNGMFTKLNEPVKHKEIKLPEKERNFEAKKRYKIKYGKNPNKCSIFHDTGLILFDESFLKLPLYVRYGIYFHELGHNYYKTEEYADLYSIKKMYEHGFNTSQIGRVPLLSLSEHSHYRKVLTLKTLLS